MDCYLPGQVVVGPGPEWSPDAEGTIREELGHDFAIVHDVADLLRANDVAIPDEKEAAPVIIRRNSPVIG